MNNPLRFPPLLFPQTAVCLLSPRLREAPSGTALSHLVGSVTSPGEVGKVPGKQARSQAGWALSFPAPIALVQALCHLLSLISTPFLLLASFLPSSNLCPPRQPVGPWSQLQSLGCILRGGSTEALVFPPPGFLVPPATWSFSGQLLPAPQPTPPPRLPGLAHPSSSTSVFLIFSLPLSGMSTLLRALEALVGTLPAAL